MTDQVLGVIPARLASSRLPRKPLHPLLGRPLIEWVWQRVSAMSVLDHVVVATDSPEVADVCLAFGAPVEMTRTDHGSGTDRVAEVAARAVFSEYGIVANIQGDEPLLDERNVQAAVDMVRAGWDVGTCAAHIGTEEEWHDPSVVKVVRSDAGGALYFSRAAIPHERAAAPEGPREAPRERDGGPRPADRLRHVGVYVYRQEALSAWAALPPGDLERSEMLEQLRPLAAGQRIGVAVVARAARGVDTPADAKRMEETLSRMVTDAV